MLCAHTYIYILYYSSLYIGLDRSNIYYRCLTVIGYYFTMFTVYIILFVMKGLRLRTVSPHSR